MLKRFRQSVILFIQRNRRALLLGAFTGSLILLAGFIRLGYNIPWTGFGTYSGTNGELYLPKTLWD